MTQRQPLGRVAEIIRYYQAGLLNAAFGFGLYALLVRLGLNMYVAQIVGTVIGTAFNYFTYSRHVFRGFAPAKGRFVAAYALNYLVGLAALIGISQFVHSPYMAGFAALIVASLINYVALKRLVFRAPT